jgi:IS605 OrfB family transposase
MAKKKKQNEKDPITAQSRIKWTPVLQDIALLLSGISNKHFVDRHVHNIEYKYLKKDSKKRLGIQNRYLNAIESKLEGVVKSNKSNLDRYVLGAQRRIKKLEEIFPKLKKPQKIAWYAKQIEKTKNKLVRLEKDKEENKIRICFGSNDLFKAQFHLKENGFASHEEWLKAWQFERNNSFFVLGTGSEKMGNQLCQINKDLTELRITVPYILEPIYGKYIKVPVVFKHNREHIENAIKNKQAISYLFHVDPCGKAYVFATTDRIKVKIITNRENGMLAIDQNEDHLALRLLEKYGNPKGKPIRIEMDLRGKRTDQAKAIMEQAALEASKIAVAHKVPIGTEDLDFEKKKDEMIPSSKRMKKMLSSLVYAKFPEILNSRTQKDGVEVIVKNPAYTSIIGKANWSSVLGTSDHDGGAIGIGRRAQGFGEKPKRHVINLLPVRNRREHPWRYWSEVRLWLASEAASRKTGVLRWRANAPPAATARRASERLEAS